jgi:hypothetical protein
MKDIVIIGGGTAGWMAAISIACRFPDKHVTIIDPKLIGPIGVGESVTGALVSFILEPRHRLTLGDLFRRCDATCKTGLWYKDWKGIGTDYVSPIDQPADYFKHFYPTHAEEFYAQVSVDRARLGEVQLYSFCMRKNRTDQCWNPDGSVNTNLAQFSVHFDALKFAGWLQEISPRYENIRHIDDVIESFQQDPDTGFVKSIRTKTGREIGGDFFVDCTGFHRLLFAKAFKPRWISYEPYIKVDSAIPFFPHYAPGQEPPVYTVAQAMPNGWMWQIPTQSRFGMGYLFSSRYTDAQGARKDLLARGLDPGENPRVLKFTSGRYETQWIKNVCTIGLSAGFIEPLESTTIHAMAMQIRFLTDLFLPYYTSISAPVLAEHYSRLVTMAYEDYLDFISLHYHAGRTDTEFWRDYQKPESVTDRNRARLEKWRYAFPVREDFAGIFTQRAGQTLNLNIWAPMLCGLNLLKREFALRVVQMSDHPTKLRENIDRYVKIRDRIASSALTHSESIKYILSQP